MLYLATVVAYRHLFDNLLLALDAVLLEKGVLGQRLEPRAQVNFTYLLEFLHERIVDLAVHRGENALLRKSAVQDLLDSDRARDAD